MARSRRRSANRSSSSTGMLNIPNLVKIGSGLLVAAAGTYGVFYTVSNMPSGAQNVYEGVETGTIDSEMSLSQKPPLPDEPGFGQSPANTQLASNVESAGPKSLTTKPIDATNDPLGSMNKNGSTNNVLARTNPSSPAPQPNGAAKPGNGLTGLPEPGLPKTGLPNTGLPNTLRPDSPLDAKPNDSLVGAPIPKPDVPGSLKTEPAPKQLPGTMPSPGRSLSADTDPLAGMLKPPPAAGSRPDPLTQTPAPLGPGAHSTVAPTSDPGINTKPGAGMASLPPAPGSSLADLEKTPFPKSNGLGRSTVDDGNIANDRERTPLPTPARSSLDGLPGTSPDTFAARGTGGALTPTPGNVPTLQHTTPPRSAANLGANNGLPSNPAFGNPQAPAPSRGGFASDSTTGNNSPIGIPASPNSLAGSRTQNPSQNPFPGDGSLASRSLPGNGGSAPANSSAPIGIPASNSSSFNQPNPGTMAGGNTPSAPSSQLNPQPRLGDVNVRPAANLEATPPAATSRSNATSLVSNQPGDPRWDIQQNAAVILEKHAPEQVQVNVPAKFILVVRNVGRVPAANVLIRDRVPQGARLVQTTPKPDRQVGDLMEWDIAALPPGETLQITTELVPTQAGELGSVAEVSLAAVAACRTRSTQPKLVIEHSAPPQVLVGQQIVMNITVRNDGDGPAENVVIRDVVPDGLKHVSGKEIENPIGRLLPGQSRNLQLPLLAVAPGNIRNTISVSGDGKLTNEHSISLQVVSPQLQVNMTGPERRYLSRQTEHQLQVQNSGSANATNVQMMAKLPRGLKYESSSPAGRYDPSRHAVFWAMQQLPSGQAETISLSTLPMEPGQQEIEFQALADLNQPQSIKRPLLVEQLSELFFEIDDLEDPIEVNSNTTYVVRVENQGSQVATDVKLVAHLPQGIRFVQVESPVEYQVTPAGDGGQDVNFAPIPVLNPEAKLTMRIMVQGQIDGDHRIEARLTSAQRQTAVAKQETTKVYSDSLHR